MNTNTIKAIIKKELRDTLHNRSVLIQFILFPIITLIMVSVVPMEGNLQPEYFATVFGTMLATFVPISSASGIIAEEKENNTLRVLVMSSVKPLEYLLSVGIYILFFTSLGIASIAFIGGLSGWNLIYFISVLMIGTTCSLLLGCSIGMSAKSQANATGIMLPFAALLSVVPTLAMYNETIGEVSSFLYSQQVNALLTNYSISNFTWNAIIIILLNIIVLVTVFVFSYKNGKKI